MNMEILGQSLVFIILLFFSLLVMLWAMTLLSRKVHLALDEIAMLKNEISILNNEIEVLMIHVRRQAEAERGTGT